MCKRTNGVYYTQGNPFDNVAFRDWAAQANLPSARILEPFAGANNIIQTLQNIGLCGDFASYDISPTSAVVETRDTIQSFPKGFDVCVTNPPWLAKNSATRRGLPYPKGRHDDLYKHCLELCLVNCNYVAALIPASYLQSGLFRGRLSTYILLHETLFSDTENPVCLALFTDKLTADTHIYHDDKYIGVLEQLAEGLPREKQNRRVRFNDPQGELGFISFDNTKEPSIRFCHADEIQNYSIKVSSRFITRISGHFGDVSRLVGALNTAINDFRNDTNDTFLTPFKGIRDDGQYRRRMDFGLARRFINAA